MSRRRRLARAAAAIAAAAALAGATATQEAAPGRPACAERPALEAERQALRGAIADIATGRWAKQRKKQRKLSGKAAGRAAAGTAASVLLPFPFGLAANAVASAAGGKKKPEPLPEGPDAAPLIARQQAVEARLAALASSGC